MDPATHIKRVTNILNNLAPPRDEPEGGPKTGLKPPFLQTTI